MPDLSSVMPDLIGHLPPSVHRRFLAQLFPRFTDALLDDVRLNLEAAGYGFHVNLPFDGVRNLRYRIGNLINQVGFLERVVSRFREHEVCLEDNAVLLLLLDECLNLFQRMLAGEGVRIVTVRKEHHARIHAFPEDEADGADGGMQAGFIAIVHDGDILGELADEPDLLLRERRSAGGYHVGDAHLVHHHHVHVALYQDASVRLGDLALGEVDAQQVAALDVDFRFRRVDVLGRVVRFERAAAIGDDTSAHGMDGKHHALAEFIDQLAIVLLNG